MSDGVHDKSICISPSAADALIGAGDGSAALLYLFILRNGGVFDSESAASALSLPRDKVESAFLKLSGLGVLGKAALAREDAPPDYSAEDIKMRLNDSAEFSGLVQEMQRRLGRILSGGDLTILFGIFDYLGLPAEVILTLITYCIEENRRRYGEGRMPTMRYIEKEAYAWARLGIFTQDLAEEHLRRKIETKRKTEELKRALGIKNRELSPTEEKYLTAWMDMGFERDAIELAYDKTVVKTGELSWAYMNSIIKNWRAKGLLTVAEINEGDGRREPPKKASGKAEAPTQEEFERMRRYLDKMI